MHPLWQEQKGQAITKYYLYAGIFSIPSGGSCSEGFTPSLHTKPLRESCSPLMLPQLGQPPCKRQSFISAPLLCDLRPNPNFCQQLLRGEARTSCGIRASGTFQPPAVKADYADPVLVATQPGISSVRRKLPDKPCKECAGSGKSTCRLCAGAGEVSVLQWYSSLSDS